jgi:type I restriction enzyme, S subunit
LLKETRQAVISHAVTKGLNPNAKMRDSGVEWLGEVPEGWEVWKLCHFAPVITCGVAVTPEYVDDGVIFLSAQNVKQWKINLEKGHKYISQKSHAALTRNRMPINGDILLSRVGTIGEVCVVDVDFEFSIFVSLTHLRINNSVCSNEFFVYLCESQYVRSMHGAVTLVGGGVGNLNVNDLRVYRLVMPPLQDQQEIVEFLRGQIFKIDQLIGKTEQAVALIQERRTALISAAVTGKIDVRDWVAPEETQTNKEVAA